MLDFALAGYSIQTNDLVLGLVQELVPEMLNHWYGSGIKTIRISKAQLIDPKTKSAQDLQDNNLYAKQYHLGLKAYSSGIKSTWKAIIICFMPKRKTQIYN